MTMTKPSTERTPEYGIIADDFLPSDFDHRLTLTVSRDRKELFTLYGIPSMSATKLSCALSNHDALVAALRLLVQDVQDYAAWQRPCHALDVAQAALAAADNKNRLSSQQLRVPAPGRWHRDRRQSGRSGWRPEMQCPHPAC